MVSVWDAFVSEIALRWTIDEFRLRKLSSSSIRMDYAVEEQLLWPADAIPNEHDIPVCREPEQRYANDGEEASAVAAWVWWASGVALPAIAALGLCCNLLNVLILSTNKGAKRIPSWRLLLGVGVADCLFLALASLEQAVQWWAPSLSARPSIVAAAAMSAPFLRAAAATAYKTSVLLVVAFNAERYACVVEPLRTPGLLDGRRTPTLVTWLALISLITSLHWPLCYEVRSCFETELGVWLHVVVLRQNEFLQNFYTAMDHVALVCFNVLPVVAVCIMNARLVVTLNKVAAEDERKGSAASFVAGCGFPTNPTSNRRRRLVRSLCLLCRTRSNDTTIPDALTTLDGSEETRRRRRLGAHAMLWAVVGLLLVCVAPQAPARLLFHLYGQYHSTAVLYTCFTQLLVFLNASLNFALYCLVSGRYRSLLRQTCSRIWRKLTCCCCTGRSGKRDSCTTQELLLSGVGATVANANPQPQQQQQQVHNIPVNGHESNARLLVLPIGPPTTRLTEEMQQQPPPPSSSPTSFEVVVVQIRVECGDEETAAAAATAADGAAR